VIESRDGTTLYGSTYRGGQTSGFSLLHSFDWGIDGSLPFGGVMQASDGAFYGTTCSGGQHGGGTIYRWNGALTVLHAFSEDVDGFCPAFNGIIEGSDGAFDGTTYWGESAVPDAAGTLWVHLFSGSDGSWPSGWLVRGPDGALYGTTSEGGPGGVGVLFRRPTYLPGGMCLGEPGHAILPPIRADGMSVFRQGASVPAKFRVCDASGQSVGTPGVVTSFRLVGTIVGTTVTAMDEPVPSTTGQSEFRWEAGAQQWIFNISTRTLAADTTYLFRIELDDGSAIDFRFALR
jgi:uncharacterized repeat protein (TIGR03803 family)